MTYKQPTIKSFERGEVSLQFTDSHGEVHKIDDSERQENEVFSRVMGYLRPVSIEGWPQWNPGKISEFNERVWFKMPKEVTDAD